VRLIWAIPVLLLVVAVAVTAILVMRRRAPEGSYFEDGDRASGIFGVLATGFSILAGFVLFLAFSSYDQSRTGAESEALAVVQQFETAQYLPADVREELSGELVCYGRSVVHQEWPSMENGTIGETINPWSIRLFASLKEARPTASTEDAAYSKWLDQTSDREAARHDRVHGATGIVPASIWIVLLFSATIIFAFTLFFADSGERAVSQAMLIGSAAAIVTGTLLAIVALDKPYRPGLGSLRPIAMERSLVLLDEALRDVVELTDAPPCTASGAPT
jgi:hypothetical protein